MSEMTEGVAITAPESKDAILAAAWPLILAHRRRVVESADELLHDLEGIDGIAADPRLILLFDAHSLVTRLMTGLIEQEG